ncbi:hypothetical protein [Aureimonas sp. AU40]|uniref:hypothetical protein n=1 Tax=Aureimonas sp. AU40 TaxID=1637747 RepID=UPI000784B67F|nr:hypothetical protein [Aureimonas sp. AU40]
MDDDVARGRPSLLNMIAEGTVTGDAPRHAELLRQTVLERLHVGPAPLTQGELNAWRYEITDAINDLKGERSTTEALAIGAMLYPKLVRLTLRGRDRWFDEHRRVAPPSWRA